jgi:phosphoglycolate phosphatase-like HAD superfamily hydrolase
VRHGAALVLFDLDGTVLTFDGPSPGPGRTALALAMRDLFGIPDATEGIRLAGATDRGVVTRMLECAGAMADERSISRVFSRYIEHLEHLLETRRYRTIGSVRSTVADLGERGAAVGIGTGNVRQGARLKLRAAGLENVFDLDRGGYGCDSAIRAEIIALAIRRCGVTPETPVLVVGDTRHDVDAARAVGAQAIGVATTHEAFAELSEAGADCIFEECGSDLVSYVLSLSE